MALLRARPRARRRRGARVGRGSARREGPCKAFRPERVLFVPALPKTRAPRSYAEPRAEGARPRPGRPVVAGEPRGWRRSQMPSELEGQAALVTGGGRGVGANVARSQHAPGCGSRSRPAARIRSRKRRARSAGSPSSRTSPASGGRRDGREGRARARPGRPARGERRDRALGTSAWAVDADWWQVFEVNVLGVYLCCRAVIPAMIERGRGRIVITASGAAACPPRRRRRTRRARRP